MPGLFSNKLRQFSVLVLGATLSLSACAPKDQRFNEGRGRDSGGGSGNNKGDSGVATYAVDERQADLARHLLLQLTDARRIMDQALNLKHYDRMLLPAAKKIQLTDCRNLTKVSPKSDRKIPAFTEKFDLVYEDKKCGDEAPADKAGQSLKRGAERFSMVYNANLPKEGDSEIAATLATRFPVSVTVEGRDLAIDLVTSETFTEKSGRVLPVGRARLNIVMSLNAELVDEDEKSLTYSVNYEHQNQFKDANLGPIFRLGEIKRMAQDVVMTVDRATRQITSVKLGRMDVTVNLQDWVKLNLEGKPSGGGKSLANSSTQSAKLELKAEGDLVLPKSLCSPIEGVFVVTKQQSKKNGDEQQPDPLKLTVTAEKATVNGAEKALKLCNDKEDPLFAAELGAVYL